MYEFKTVKNEIGVWKNAIRNLKRNNRKILMLENDGESVTITYKKRKVINPRYPKDITKA